MEQAAYRIVKYDDRVAIIDFRSQISQLNKRNYRSLFKLWLLNPATIFAFDFEGVESMPPPFVENFVRFTQELEQHDKNWGSLKLLESLVSEMESQSLLPHFRIAGSIEDIIAQAKKNMSPKAWSDGFFSALQKSIHRVFAVQFDIPLQMGKPKVRAKGDGLFQPEVASIVDVTTHGFRIAVAMTFDEENIGACYRQMMAGEAFVFEENAKDVVRELLNITYCQVKPKVNSESVHLPNTIPRVCFRPGFRNEVAKVKKVVHFPFSCKEFCFAIEILIP